MRRRGSGLTLLAFATLAAVAAGDTSRSVSLDGPEVYKLDWNTRGLIEHDLDRDGRTDLAVLNNDRARVDVLYQTPPGKRRTGKTASNRWAPVLEDARFEKRSIVTGGTMYALAAGDLDGDGRADLAFTGKRDPLTILYQGKKTDDWSRRRVIEIDEPVPWTGSLQATDLDGDGRDDLVVLAKTRLLVFRQDDRGELTGPDVYPLADEGCYGLVARDLDGDRRVDLMYLMPKSQSAWRARFQVEAGRLGPEQVFRMESPSATLVPLADTTGELPRFAMVQRRTKLVELVSLVASHEKESPETIRLHPRVFASASRGAREPSYALGDLDGDGRQDLAVADARSAQVQVYLQRDGGFGLATGYPTLPEVRSLAAADIDDDGRDELLLVSTSEGVLGVSEMSDEGRLSYPRPLATSGSPLAVSAGNLGGKGDVLVYLYEDDGERGVALLDPRGGRDERRIPLDGLRTDPGALRILDANQDGRADLAVFIVQSPMRLLLQDDGGAFVEATRETGYRPGLVDDLPARALGSGDVDGDGMPEMLVAGEGFARSMRVNAAGELVVLDQFNARDPGDTVEAAVAVDLDADGTTEILLAVEGDESLQLLRRDAQGVYRYQSSVPVGSIELLGTDVVDLDGDSVSDLLFWGADRFWWIPVGGSGRYVDTLASYESELEEMVPSNLAVGDLNHDGLEEIVVVDSVGSRIMEILTSDAERVWRNTLHFTIFEADPHYQGRTGANREPRELLISDLTADGKADLALLVHDRVLLYPQR